MHDKTIAVVLAAGKGTRMKSNHAKVLHEVFFKPMLHHVLDAVIGAGIERIAVIVGHQREKVLAAIDQYAHLPVIQKEQLGTGHAVLCAKRACEQSGQVMILCGDTPLIRPETLQKMIDDHQRNRATVTLMTTVLDDPFGYGRVISDEHGNIVRIVEQKDADDNQQNIREINTGIYLVERKFLFQALQQVGTDNSQGEVYLTDIIEIARKDGHAVHKFFHPHAIDVLGVNSRVELAQAHGELQMRHNRKVMLSGVTMYSPETILLDPESTIGRDTIIQGEVQITGRSKVGQNARLETGVILQKCTLGAHAVIGANSVLHNCTVEAEEHIPPLTYKVG